jgi:hypothetical protein
MNSRIGIHRAYHFETQRAADVSCSKRNQTLPDCDRIHLNYRQEWTSDPSGEIITGIRIRLPRAWQKASPSLRRGKQAKDKCQEAVLKLLVRHPISGPPCIVMYLNVTIDDLLYEEIEQSRFGAFIPQQLVDDNLCRQWRDGESRQAPRPYKELLLRRRRSEQVYHCRCDRRVDLGEISLCH